MTGAAELIERAAAAGLELIPAGGKLRVRGLDPLPGDLVDALREHKHEVLALLAPPVVADALGGVAPASGSLTAADLARMPINTFSASLLVVEMRSAILGETVVLAGDDAHVDPERYRGRALYRAAELVALLRAKPAPAELRDIHHTKRMFGGSVIPS